MGRARREGAPLTRREYAGRKLGAAGAEERRRLYTAAREAGASIWDAAQAAGVDPAGSGPRYERWHQAQKAGIPERAEGQAVGRAPRWL
jgi:hypothetical protein